jgi:hypothetical protein
VGPFCVVELEGPGEGIEDRGGDAGGVAAFELGVVLARDPGQEGDLVAFQAGHPAPVGGVRLQSRLLRGELGPPGGEELLDLDPDIADGAARFVLVTHANHPTSGRPR